MPVDLAVVPVAGQGTRTLPATKSQPKEMLPVGRKPVVQYVVEELVQSGISRLMFVTGMGKVSIENHFDDNAELTKYLRETGREEQLKSLSYEQLDVEYFYTRQREQLGLGHAVLCSRPLVDGQPFVVALGDSIIGCHAESDIVQRMTEEFDRSGADVVIAFEEVPRAEVVRYGIAQTLPGKQHDEVFDLVDMIEKPSVKDAPSELAVAARYVFSPAIFDALEQTSPGKGNEIQLTDAIRLLLKSGKKGVGMRLCQEGERRYDIGNFTSYFRAFTEFAMTDPEEGKVLRDHLRKWLADYKES